MTLDAPLGVPGRRALLRGAGAVGLVCFAGALGGCGGGGAESTAVEADSAVKPAAAAKPAAKPVAAADQNLGPAADVPVGGGKVFRDAKVVVTQPKKGQFKAFTAICTHTGCPVAEVADGTINCPCHGSQFSITDGSVVTPPAPKPLAAMKVTVVGGNLMLSA